MVGCKQNLKQFTIPHLNTSDIRIMFHNPSSLMFNKHAAVSMSAHESHDNRKKL
jgi:hypothetical protein